MQDDLIRKAMLGMGWDPDAAVPMANEENLQLLQALQEMFEEKAELKEKQSYVEERVEKLLQHAKNAESSITHNLKLLHEHQLELQNEIHLAKVAEREHSKLQEDLKNELRESDNTKDLLATTEKELCKRQRKIDEMTNRIKWAKTALIEWNEAMEAGHKGYQLIEKYFREDQLRANQQHQRHQQLHDEIEKYRKQLIMLNDEQKSLEQNLECTANLYRNAHAERRQVVELWKSAVTQMVQRERDIQNNEVLLVQLKNESQQKADEQKRFDDKLTDIMENNRQIEATIDELNRDSSDIKEKIQILVDMAALKENEVEIVQKELQNLSNRVQIQRAENRQNEKTKIEKLKELQEFDEVLQRLEARCASMDHKNTNAQQRLQILEDMNNSEEKAQQELNKEIERINELTYRSEQQLRKFKDEERVMKVQNDGIQVSIQAIKKSIQVTEKELRRQTEIHYELGFKCLQIERDIIKIKGGTVDPEIEQRNLEYLAQLEEQHSKVIKRSQATEAQNRKLDDNMRKLTNIYNHDNKELGVIQFKIKEAQVYCEGGIKTLKVETKKNQLLIVELSLLKMRANQFENDIASCEDSTFNLQKHRLLLIRTVKDRIIECKSQMDLLTLKRKHLCEELSTLRADIGERNKHIEAVRARFELTAQLLGTNEDGTLVTPTQLKVETAQEKQMLLDEGNNLNEKVLKAEAEIEAMENTLMLLNKSNDNYRNNFKRIEDDDEAQNEVKNLQANYCKALNELKNLRNKIFKMTEQNERETLKREELEAKLELVTRKRLETSEILSKLQKELLDQKVKLQRAEREMKLALKSVKQRAFSREFLAMYDRDLDLRELEQRNTNALNQLADMADNDDIIGPKIIRLMAERGLKMPHLLQKTRSFASWRSEVSDASYSSSRNNFPRSTSRSSSSSDSQLHIQASSTVVSVVSIDFPGSN